MSALSEYETVCVLTPETQGEAFTALDKKIQKLFAQHKAGEVAIKDWGNRKLAYPIKKYKTAHYVQYVYTAPGALIPELERNLGYEESILRFLTVKYDKNTRKGVMVEPDGFEPLMY